MADVSASTPCPGCGAQVHSDYTYCHACGRALGARGKAEKVQGFVDGALRHAQNGTRAVMENATAQKVAGGALLGAGAAVLIPFVTMGVGATLGAAYVGYKLLKKD